MKYMLITLILAAVLGCTSTPKKQVYDGPEEFLRMCERQGLDLRATFLSMLIDRALAGMRTHAVAF
jgi:hypothetical protein